MVIDIKKAESANGYSIVCIIGIGQIKTIIDIECHLILQIKLFQLFVSMLNKPLVNIKSINVAVIQPRGQIS